MGWLTLQGLYLLMFFIGFGMTVSMLALGLWHGVVGQFGHDDLGHGHFEHGGGHDLGDHASGDQIVPSSSHHEVVQNIGAQSEASHTHLFPDALYYFSFLFSPTMLSIFLTMFGGIGYLCTQTQVFKPAIVNLPLSLILALFSIFGIFVPLRRWIGKLEATSHPTAQDLIGVIGKSLSPISPNGIGTISYEFKGIRHTAPARNRTNKLINRAALVRVVDVVGSLLIIESAEERLEVWEKL